VNPDDIDPALIAAIDSVFNETPSSPPDELDVWTMVRTSATGIVFTPHPRIAHILLFTTRAVELLTAQGLTGAWAQDLETIEADAAPEAGFFVTMAQATVSENQAAALTTLRAALEAPGTLTPDQALEMLAGLALVRQALAVITTSSSEEGPIETAIMITTLLQHQLVKELSAS
jgi:hypothetical protein